MTPDSITCQRWNTRRHSWRHPSEGGFDARRYVVEPIHETLAGAFVETHHYAGSMPATRLSYGLHTDGTLVGVAVLSVPMQASVLTNVFPRLEPYAESLELGRFVLLDEVPANGESWFLGQVWRHAADAGVRGVVSFADPMPRQRIVVDVVDGTPVERTEIITPGHIGLIYQAVNGYACGRSTPRSLTYLPRQGLVLSARTLQKIRQQEAGAESAERRLVEWGAVARRAGENPTTWLRRALEDVGTVRVRHPGNYRYAWPLGRTRSERRTVIAMPRTGYPKMEAA